MLRIGGRTGSATASDVSSETSSSRRTFSKQRMLWLCLSTFSGTPTPLMDKSPLDEDTDNVFVVFVQNPHDIG
jgi:hypothetical protein